MPDVLHHISNHIHPFFLIKQRQNSIFFLILNVKQPEDTVNQRQRVSAV